MAKRRKHASDTDSDDDEDDDNNAKSSVIDDKKTSNEHHKKKKSKKPKVAEKECDDEKITKQTENNELKESPDACLAWTEEEMRTLVERIEKQLPDEDTIPYSRRVAKLDWKKIQFDPFSAEDCKNKFQEILLKQRKHRLCSEILQDIKEWVKKPWKNNSTKSKVPKRHPDMPPAPLSSYFLFIREKKKKVQKKHPHLSVTELSKLLGEMFNSLPEDKKEKYTSMALKEREEYNVKLKEFYLKHPEEIVEKKKHSRSGKVFEQIGPSRPLPPFKLFCESKINKHKDEPDFDSKQIVVKCKEHWKNMSDKKKATWIKWTLDREQEYMIELAKFVKEHPNFDTSKMKQSILTKEEKAILDRVAGKPKKPPVSAYGYFCSVNMTNDSFHNGRVDLKGLAERWNALSDEEKKAYAEKVKKLQERYKEDFTKYLETLPEEKRIEELQNLEKVNQKKKPIHREKNQQTISRWIEKKKDEITENNLYKNEPPRPPGNAFELFLKKCTEKRPNLPEEKQLAKAKLKWSALSVEKRNKYKEEVEAQKRKYIKEYTAFLKHLTEKELAEYSIFKKRESNLNNSEESDSVSSSDDDDDNKEKKQPEASSSSEEDDSDSD